MWGATIFLFIAILGFYLLSKMEDAISYKESFNAKIWSLETENNITTLIVVRDEKIIKAYECTYDERLDYLKPGDEVFVEEDKEYVIYHYLTKQTFVFNDANS